MKNIIIERLGEIEEENAVKILYACESGSRAWGFPSANSDYDVRFIYIHPVEWYLSLKDKRDVIEYPIDDQLDINGWDLQKALLLFRKSNPPLMEWLGSPIVYREDYSVAEHLRQLAKKYYSPISSSYHYMHMAKGNFREYLKGDQVWLKKYFYALRPILAVIWIERGLGVVPTEFELLVNEVVKQPDLKNAIDNLLNLKREGSELDSGPRIDVISDFIEKEISRFDALQIDSKNLAAPTDVLDSLFLSALDEVWSFSAR